MLNGFQKKYLWILY